MVAGVFIPELLGNLAETPATREYPFAKAQVAGRIPRHSAHEAGPLCRLQGLRARLHVGSD